MNQLQDFYQGETKRWRVEWPTDIAGAVITFRLSRRAGQANADLEIAAELDAPDANGEVFGAVLEITAAASATLTPAEYQAEHHITLADGDAGIFGRQEIKVKKPLPPGA